MGLAKARAGRPAPTLGTIAVGVGNGEFGLRAGGGVWPCNWIYRARPTCFAGAMVSAGA